MTIAFFLLLVPDISSQDNSQRLKFERITPDQGLTTGNLTGMMKDSRGFVWFMSTDGIDRFDGNDFKHFRSDPEDNSTISSGKPMSCAEDKNGIIWFACAIPQGLNAYNPYTGKFKRYSEIPFYKNKLPDGRVLRILVDNKNILWMTAEGQGIYSWDQQTNVIRHYTHDPADSSSLANNNAWGGEFDASGNIFFCSPDNIDLLDVSTGKFTHFPLHLKSGPINFGNWDIRICPDSKKNLWIATPEGLKSLNLITKQFTDYRHSDSTNSMSENNAIEVKESPDGRIWITSQKGLNIFDPATKNFSVYNPAVWDPHAIDPFQYGLYYDNSGVMWIWGGWMVDKVNLTPEKFKTEWSWPACIYQDSDGEILVGAQQGVDVFDPATRKFTPFLQDETAKKLLAGHKMQTIFQDKDGVYWFGADDTSVITYNAKNKNWKVFQYKEKHDPDSLGVYSILSPLYQDHQGKIWFGGLFTLCNYDPLTQKFKSYLINPEKQTVSANSVFSIFDPGDGRTWFASVGLSYYDPKQDKIIQGQFNQNTASKILSTSRISCSLNAGNQCMWIGTIGNGLFFLDFKTGQCARISTKDGLCNDVVYGIIKDKHENLWLTTGNGLAKYTAAKSLFDDKEKGIFRTYSIVDGLPVRTCSSTHPLYSKDGVIYFDMEGGFNGLVRFNPDSLKDNSFIPPVFITDFRLFNKSVLPGDSSRILNSTIESTKEIILNYKQNVISFTFAALSFVHPENNRYAYKLDNFDRDWIYTNASKRSANYTNLDPGDYTFEVKASNNDGTWNETPTILHLVITPPFWQTWWFRIAMIATIAVGVYSLYRFRLNQLLRLQSIRNKIAHDLHDDIGSTLNSISVFSQVAQQEPEKQKAALEIIGESSRKVIEAMSDIVWTINPEHDSFEEIILRMRSFSYNLFRAKNIDHVFRADESLNDLKLSLENRRNFYLFFKEAINNLIKHSAASRSEIQLSYEDRFIVLIIRDNGKGFDTSQEYNGNGISSMRKRADEMKGLLSIESSLNSGTTIQLKIRT